MWPAHHPLLVVLDAGPVVEGAVAERVEPLRHLVGDVALERQQGGRVGLAEVEAVQVEQPAQLGDRVGWSSTRRSTSVSLAAVAAVRTYDQQRRALAAAPVPAGLVAGGEGREQPLGEGGPVAAPASQACSIASTTSGRSRMLPWIA